MKLMKRIKIGKTYIGDREKVFIIAEAGVNHEGSLKRAKELIRKAAESGADAIKFQTYKADTLVIKRAPKFWDYKRDVGKTQHEAYSQLDKFPWRHYSELIKVCNEHNIEFLSTPFDYKAVDWLDGIGMKAFKVASSDLTYLSFLEHIAKKNKPILLSTGAATLGQIEEAVNTIKKYHNKIIVLHCTLCYPTKPEDANLNIISTLKTVFPDLHVGLSDHTLGITAPIVATVLGAKVIEKHYTVDKKLKKNADHWLSVDPPELKEMVNRIRETEKLLGSVIKQVFKAEEHTYKYDKRSIVSAKDIKKEGSFTKKNLTCKRPGTGIPPKFMDIVVGRIAKQNIPEDTVVTWEMIK